jgi:hypothetical protein
MSPFNLQLAMRPPGGKSTLQALAPSLPKIIESLESVTAEIDRAFSAKLHGDWGLLKEYKNGLRWEIPNSDAVPPDADIYVYLEQSADVAGANGSLTIVKAKSFGGYWHGAEQKIYWDARGIIKACGVTAVAAHLCKELFKEMFG